MLIISSSVCVCVLPSARNRRLRSTAASGKHKACQKVVHMSRCSVHGGGRRDQWLNVCSQRGPRDTSLQCWRKRSFLFFFSFQGHQARSLWCRRCRDASPERLGLCRGISTSICLAAVRRLLECARANTPRESLQRYQLKCQSSDTRTAILITRRFSVPPRVFLQAPMKWFWPRSECSPAKAEDLPEVPGEHVSVVCELFLQVKPQSSLLWFHHDQILTSRSNWMLVCDEGRLLHIKSNLFGYFYQVQSSLFAIQANFSNKIK